jgi:hypothetical protein
MIYPLLSLTFASPLLLRRDSPQGVVVLASKNTPMPKPRGDIAYRYGKKVLAGTKISVYNIFYGKWTPAQIALTEDFIKNIGASQWWDISNQYYYQASSGSKKVFITDEVVLGKSVVDKYSLGTSLKNNNLPELIQAQIDSKGLPEDENAVYFVLISSDVKESIRADLGDASFCQQYCGYHISWKVKSGKRVFYSLVGLPPKECLDGCADTANVSKSPNDDPALDAMLSVLAHELTEAATDPISDIDDERAWEDDQRYENADKCSWSFGKTFQAPNGSKANIKLNGKNYLIQENWDRVKQRCTLSQ